jgi:RND family efflux transporter MFP subunit
MKQKIIPILSILLFTFAACSDGDHRPIQPDSATVRVQVVEATRTEVPIEVDLHGVVEAGRTAAVSTRIMATVTRVLVQTGERVEDGQLLLTIDAEATQGNLAQAHGALAQVRAALALAERNYQRFQALAETNAASELEVDMARMEYEQARGAVEQGEGAVLAAGSIAADSNVAAPFSGRVALRMVEVGDLAAPGRPLLLIESEGALQLSLAVPESLVVTSGLTLGSTLSVAIDSRPDLGEIAGTVVEMTPGADPLSHSFEAKVALPTIDLSTGAAGRASIKTGSRQAVTVPADALLRHGGLELVVLDVGGQTSSRAVTIGRTIGDGSLEVLSGLHGGERVLVGLEAMPAAGTVVEEIG